MPFETLRGPQPRIAVIGGGISGLGAAYHLSRSHAVTLFEAEPRLGGHARTVMAGRRGDQPVDMGFIVYNNANYPNLTELFSDLNVPVAKSNMSFGTSFHGGRFEYALNSVSSLFAQRQNALNPKFLRMIRDILHFNKHALRVSRENQGCTVGELLTLLGTGNWFRDRYLLPFSGAIWSTPKQKILDFPAYAMLQFFENHALLSYTGQHQWYTVQGGSIEYVSRLSAELETRGVELRCKAPIEAVRRGPKGVEVRPYGSDWESFDQIVFATHSDDTLSLLADASEQEERVLGAIRYQPNEVVLHADARMMPKRKSVWSSWVYTEDKDAMSDQIDLTYWMNSLQPIPQDDPLFVTLNTKREIRQELIHDTAIMRHPVYDLEMLAAQKEARSMNGQNNTWFCGAWMRNGFHEDGLASAIDVADAIALRSQAMVAAE